MVEGDRDERFSTEGLEFEPALRRVLAGGRDDEQAKSAEQGGAMQDAMETELTDEELLERVKSLEDGVEDGSLPMFYDADSMKEYMNKHFPR